MEELRPITSRFTIEKAKNGFLVYINENHSLGNSRPIPYVFEYMENLLEFVEYNFRENGI
jgi:hypothetical protein